MNEQNWIAIIGAVFAGLTSIITLIFTLTERRRRSLQELATQKARDEMALAVEAAKLSALQAAIKAEELKDTVIESKTTREKQISELGKSLTSTIQATGFHLSKKVDDNTAMNEKALDAANGVNVKIQSLGLQLAEQKGAAIGAAQQQDTMQAANVTIEAKNVEIHETPPVKP